MAYRVAIVDDRLSRVGCGIILNLKATSKNSFLMIWARDFSSRKVSESPECFVYCGLLK